MLLTSLTTILAMAGPGASGQGGQGSPPFWSTLIFPVLLIVIFYFMLIRPQQQRTKQHTEMMKMLKRGDKVITNGGIIASVVTVGDSSVTIRSGETKLEVQRSAITEVIERASPSEA